MFYSNRLFQKEISCSPPINMVNVSFDRLRSICIDFGFITLIAFIIYRVHLTHALINYLPHHAVSFQSGIHNGFVLFQKHVSAKHPASSHPTGMIRINKRANPRTELASDGHQSLTNLTAIAFASNIAHGKFSHLH